MLEIEVYGDWLDLPKQTRIGLLRSESTRGEEIFSFEYDISWINSKLAFDLDPDLRLYAGPQYLPEDKVNFGLFLDSSPDRWGRTLMKRREALLARKQNRAIRRLSESDFLLGVHDATRMGALRFRLADTDAFLSNDDELQAPPFTSIRALEQASLAVEDGSKFDDANYGEWLRLLLIPGSSLGGARPKANVVDPKGMLWIAKFPSKNDDKDSGGWEFIVNQMAHALDIRTADVQAKRYSQSHHTFLSRRFDRSANGQRLHFSSAMTLLGYKDGHDHTKGCSYLELADFLERFGALTGPDIKELWRRMVFSVAVSNTDDHLRNHGFILTPDGWRLSPAYDINPNEGGTGLSLNISEEDNSLDFGLCLEVCPLFRYKRADAEDYLKSVKAVVGTWQDRAERIGITRMEREMTAPAFDLTTKL